MRCRRKALGATRSYSYSRYDRILDCFAFEWRLTAARLTWATIRVYVYDKRIRKYGSESEEDGPEYEPAQQTFQRLSVVSTDHYSFVRHSCEAYLD
jgi:hypothetical protein